MTLAQIIAQVRGTMKAKLDQRNVYAEQLAELRRSGTTDTARVAEVRAAKDALDAELDVLQARVADLEAEQARDDATDRLSRAIVPTDPGQPSVVNGRTLAETSRPAPAEGPRWVRAADNRPAAVARGQRWVDHDVVSAHAAANSAREGAVIGAHGSLGQMVRAMSTTAGSAIVPTVWVGDIIDRARNLAAVLRAGAEIVPMDAKTVQIGRLTGDPTAAFRTEGSTITASDPTFDNVTLTATTMSTLLVGSLEWFQDADNVDTVIANAVAEAFALQLDLVGLYGSITSGAGSVSLATPPNPRGVLGTLNASASSSVLGGSTNGTAQTAASYYNELLDTIYTPRDYNESPNALIWNSKAARQYAKAYDTTGQPLRMPSDVEGVQRFVSNQIPSYTQGTMTSRATDVFVGDWSQLLIGQRLGFTIQTLTERYAENGQVGIVAHWRGDIGVARPRAFAVYKALQGAV